MPLRVPAGQRWGGSCPGYGEQLLPRIAIRPEVSRLATHRAAEPCDSLAGDLVDIDFGKRLRAATVPGAGPEWRAGPSVSGRHFDAACMP